MLSLSLSLSEVADLLMIMSSFGMALPWVLAPKKKIPTRKSCDSWWGTPVTRAATAMRRVAAFLLAACMLVVRPTLMATSPWDEFPPHVLRCGGGMLPAGKLQRPAVLFTPTPRPARAHVGYGRGCLGKLTPGACSRAACRPAPCVGRVGHSVRGVCSRMSVDDSQPEVPRHGRGANTSDASGQRRRYVFAAQQERQPSGAAANSTLRVTKLSRGTGRDPAAGERSSESEGNAQRQRPELGLKRPVPRPAEQARGPAEAGRAVRGPAAGWVRVDNDGGGGQGGGQGGGGGGNRRPKSSSGKTGVSEGQRVSNRSANKWTWRRPGRAPSTTGPTNRTVQKATDRKDSAAADSSSADASSSPPSARRVTLDVGKQGRWDNTTMVCMCVCIRMCTTGVYVCVCPCPHLHLYRCKHKHTYIGTHTHARAHTHETCRNAGAMRRCQTGKCARSSRRWKLQGPLHRQLTQRPKRRAAW